MNVTQVSNWKEGFSLHFQWDYLFYAPDLKSKHLLEVAAHSLPPRSNDDGTDLILFQMSRAG